MPSAGDSWSVVFDLPPGWVLLPPPGQSPRGLLRRDPYESLARRLASSGAVIRPLVPATAAYLERVASAEPSALAVATLVRAPSRREHTFVTVAAFPGPPAGDQAPDELARRRGDDSETPREVEPVELPWGRGARATYSRRPPHAEEPRASVQYWIVPTGLSRILVVHGDVEAPAGAPVDAYISDIDGVVRSLTITDR